MRDGTPDQVEHIDHLAIFGVMVRRVVLAVRVVLKVFIHAGLHKTGTTTIQASLFEHQERFRTPRIFLPIYKANGLGHHGLSAIRLTDAEYDKYPGKISQEECRYLEEIFISDLDNARRDNRDILISSEFLAGHFAVNSVGEIRRLVHQRGAQIVVLGYVRSPIKLVTSLIAHDQRTLSDKRSVEECLFAHIEREARVRQMFGDENVEFRIFDSSTIKGDLLSDFVTRLRRKGATVPNVPSVSLRNEGISAAACALLWTMRRRFDVIGDKERETLKMIRRLVLVYDDAYPSAKLSLPEWWEEQLVAIVADAWNDLLDRTTNAEEDRRRFRLPTSSQGGARQSFDKNECISPHFDLAYVSKVVRFGRGASREPLRKAAERLTDEFSV